MALGYAGRLFLLTLEGPGRPVVDGTDVPASLADVPDLPGLLLDAAEHARGSAGLDPAEIGVLVDRGFGDEVAAAVRARGFTLALPVDDRGEGRFAFADEEAFARDIERLEPDLTTVRVRWHPDDPAGTKKDQALGLTKLAAWLHETDRKLVIELLVPPNDGDLDAVAGDRDRDDRERRLARTLDAVREIRDLGTEADVWSVAGFTDPAAAQDLGAMVRDEGRDEVAVLAHGTAAGDTEAIVRASAAAAAYRGLVLGPDLWSADLEGLVAGTSSRVEAVRAIGDRIARVIDLSTAAPPA